eukprot:6338914-Amphidinium_carterae.1
MTSVPLVLTLLVLVGGFPSRPRGRNGFVPGPVGLSGTSYVVHERKSLPGFLSRVAAAWVEAAA